MMKKMRKFIIASVISTILLLSFAVAQSTNPWSASTAGVEKNLFKTSEDVYVKSTKLCEPASEVDVYIVEDNNNWTDGDSLDDVRGAPEPVVLISSAIPLTDLWENPESGLYDIVVDCNQNGVYDEFIDRVDSFSGPGFQVEAITGSGKAEKGSKDIGDHQWQYDSEEPNLANEMMQLALTATGEDIQLVNMTISALGTGDDAEISALEIYVDENNNGRLEENETLIGDSQPAYESNNGKVTIDLDYFLTKDVEENFLIVYQMKENISSGKFSLNVESITGIGGDSNNIIKFSGLSLKSGEKTVSPGKTCLGEVNLELLPNPVKPELNVKAIISGLSGCDGKEASLRSNPCGSLTPRTVGTCTLKTDSCNITFKSSSSLTYYVCVDKNGDKDSVDFGEYAFADLTVEQPVEENETSSEKNQTGETTTEENQTGETTTGGVNNTAGGITGGITGIAETSSFFILLEVTLLLILFVLVMILFRLRPVIMEQQKEEKAEQKSEKSEKNGKEKKK